MNIKNYLAAAGVAIASAACLLTGSVPASADSMLLPSGITVDMGQKVNVGEGKNSFIGSQIDDWTRRPDSAQTVVKLLNREGFEGTDAEKEQLAQELVGAVKKGAFYQLRAQADGTYYEGFVVSLPLTKEEGETVKAAAEKTAAPAEAQAETGAQKDILPNTSAIDRLVNHAAGRYVSVTDHTSWKDEMSRQGVSYRHGSADLIYTGHQMEIPLFVDGFISSDDAGTCYTLLIADQRAGHYFGPLLEKAFQGAKK
jgi:hypothetical protein